MTSAEQTQSQPSNEQMVFNNIARNIRGQLPAEDDIYIDAVAEHYARGIVDVSRDEKLQSVLPGLGKLESVFAAREEIRQAVGDEAADLLADKKNVVMENYWAEHPDESEESGHFFNSMVLPEGEVEDKQFDTARQKAIENRKGAEQTAADSVINDTEIQEAFQGHDEELKRALDIDIQDADTMVDFTYMANLVAKMSQEAAKS